MSYQDWLDHTDAVLRGALRRYRAALGRRSVVLENAALLHDLGKLKDKLQEWYRTYYKIGYNITFPPDALIAHTYYQQWTDEHKKAEEATNEKIGKRPGHQAEGTAIALANGWRDVAFLISGHHGGLPDPLRRPPPEGSSLPVKAIQNHFLPKELDPELGTKEINAMALAEYEKVKQEAITLIQKISNHYGVKPKNSPQPVMDVDSEFFLRLMFSCLVDSDWDDTEKWMKTQDNDYVNLRLPKLNRLYDRHKNIDEFREKERTHWQGKGAAPRILRLRDTVYNACIKAAPERTGAFTLNAPTGSAKTLGALAFALEHARIHKLRRIIYVVPYLTIVEQNAAVIRAALGIPDDHPKLGLSIFEHHSIADPIDVRNGKAVYDYRNGWLLSEGDYRRLEAIIRWRISNWDASIIITTNVQFFDSLFHNGPGRCRKLHNIARSVVILDECQNIHPHYLIPNIEMLNQWVKYAGTSFVLCTATQPQWHRQHKQLKESLQAHAIIKDPGKLFKRAARIKASWPSGEKNCWMYDELAQEMVARKKSAAIVDTRKKARQLYSQLVAHVGEDCVFHLSTSMCPLHRASELKKLHTRLDAAGKQCYLAATPILEAGVDISFPSFFREEGPFDLMVQSGGRCRRHGEGDTEGELVVFRLLGDEGEMLTSDTWSPPDPWYRKGREVLREILLAEGPPDINRPDELVWYYRKLYSSNNLDAKGISHLRHGWNFATVARLYRTIDDQSRPVLCITWQQPYGDVRSDRMDKWFQHARITPPHPTELMSSVIQRVLEVYRERPFGRWLHRLIEYLSANIFWRNFQELEKTGCIETDKETGVDIWHGPYDHRGLVYGSI